ncbi:short-chain dehydrogenase/reductase SDR family protein [Pseudohyphozyma bogoriensis]|nr:short-chain dehydrogenase/reductase SDR family protein [Pseudohyphozyma bogoriensis]
MVSSNKVYLVTGANRGIGFGLVSTLITRPDTSVFAGVRDPSKATELKKLQEKYPELYIVKLTSANVEDNEAAAAEIEKKVGRLDAVIANAGISQYYGPLQTTPLKEFREHWEVNSLGPVVLFQAVSKLLLQSPTKAPYFGILSTGGASIGNYFPLQAAAYGSSKAVANFVVKVLHFEHEADGLVATALMPGWVASDMGNAGAQANGMAAAPATVEQSVTGLLTHIEGATREKKGGKFLNYSTTSGDMPWDYKTEELVW